MQTDQIRSAPVLTKVALWSIVMRTNMKRTMGCCYQSLRPKTALTRLTLVLVPSLLKLMVTIMKMGNFVGADDDFTHRLLPMTKT